MDATIERAPYLNWLASVRERWFKKQNQQRRHNLYTKKAWNEKRKYFDSERYDSIIVDKMSLACGQKYHTLMDSYSEVDLIDFSIYFEMYTVV